MRKRLFPGQMRTRLNWTFNRPQFPVWLSPHRFALVGAFPCPGCDCPPIPATTHHGATYTPPRGRIYNDKPHMAHPHPTHCHWSPPDAGKMHPWSTPGLTDYPLFSYRPQYPFNVWLSDKGQGPYHSHTPVCTAPFLSLEYDNFFFFLGIFSKQGQSPFYASDAPVGMALGTVTVGAAAIH